MLEGSEQNLTEKQSIFFSSVKLNEKKKSKKQQIYHIGDIGVSFGKYLTLGATNTL